MASRKARRTNRTRLAGVWQMIRRKGGEITGATNERDFPHVVELALPPGGLMRRNLVSAP
jgi:hypothetical protein